MLRGGYMLCCRCKREIPDSSNFCLHCGKRITATPPQRRTRRRAKGSGTVYKLKGNRAKPWVAYSGGLLGTYATAGEAVEALDRYNIDKPAMEELNSTFAGIYDQWKKTAFPAIGEKSRDSYEQAFARAGALHGRKMRNLKVADFQEIIDGIVAEGKSRSLCEKQRLLFSQLCQYAMKQDLMNKNYAQLLVLPGRGDGKKRVISTEEQSEIRAKMQDPKYSDIAKIATVLCYTGMRINELLHMEKKDVHLEERYMVGGEKTDAGRNRSIPIHKAIVPIIEEWMQSETDWLLPSAAGTPRDDSKVRKAFQSLMRACGIQGVTPHTCRHTAATNMIAAGVRPEIVKQILGHSDFSTTVNLYTHTSAADLVSGIDLLD